MPSARSVVCGSRRESTTFLLSYMSGLSVSLVRNDAGATCPNTLHCVSLIDRRDATKIDAARTKRFFQLSCEIEGHPLGGGMLKLEPREAARIAIPDANHLDRLDKKLVREMVAEMQIWRHYRDQR